MTQQEWNISRAAAKREHLFTVYDFDEFRKDWANRDEAAEEECLLVWAMLNGREEFVGLSGEARINASWEGFEFLIKSPRSKYLAVN